MFSTEQLDTLRQEITDDLAAERIWRDVGDIAKADILNDRVNLKLDIIRSAHRKAPRMTMLTITFDGKTLIDRDVAAFSLEANAKGDVFVTASAEAAPEDGEDLFAGTGDDRLTPFERSLLTKREAESDG